MCSWSIEKLKERQKGKLVCQVLHAGRPLATLSIALAQYIQLPKRPSTEHEAMSVLGAAVERALYLYAISRLAIKAYSSSQLQSLMEKQFDGQFSLDPILSRIEKEGYLRDKELACSVQNRLFAKGKSSRYIQMNLRQRGLGEHAIEISEANELEVIRGWLNKWSKREDLMASPQKFLQRLARQGFDIAMIQQAWADWKKAVEN